MNITKELIRRGMVSYDTRSDFDDLKTAPVERPALAPTTETPAERVAADKPIIDFSKYNHASPKAIGYVMVLLRQLDAHNPGVAIPARAWWMERAVVENGRVVGSSLNRDQVSDVINRLKGHLANPADMSGAVTPATARVDDTAVNPRGKLAGILAAIFTDEVKPHPGRGVTLCRYAVNNADGDLRFYKLKESKAGRRYLVAQASDAEHFLGVENGAIAVAERIAVDPRAAMIRYGQELGVCGDCGRTLTSEWRLRGIGPICVNK